MRNKMIKRYLVLGLVLVFLGTNVSPQLTSISAQTMHKTTIYVDDDSLPPGDGTWSWPYCTIQDAIDNANPGDEIYVCNGTYQKPGPVCNIDKSLVLFACGDDPHGNDAQFPPIINASYVDSAIVVYADNVEIMGFNITGSSRENDTDPMGNYIYYMYDGIRLFNTKNCTIANNIIHHNGAGIYAVGENLIRDNMISDNLDDGIKINLGGEIRNNYITRNGRNEPKNQGDGIEIHEVNSLTIVNNTISYNHLDGIWSETGDHHHFMGNTITGNGQSGINLLESTDATIQGNTIEGNRLYGIYLNICSSNDIQKNIITRSERGINLLNSLSNTIENNLILGHSLMGINLMKSNSNTIQNNYIWNNSNGMVLVETFSNTVQSNDFRQNNISIDLFLSILDSFSQNNIISSMKIKLRAVASFSLATNNWWGDFRGPWFNMNRILLGIIIVFPWHIKGEFEIHR